MRIRTFFLAAIGTVGVIASIAAMAIVAMQWGIYRDSSEAIQVAADPLMKGKGIDAKLGVHIDLDSDRNAQLGGIDDHRIYEWIKVRNPDFPLREADFLTKCEHYYLDNAKRLELRQSFKEGFAVQEHHELYIAAVSSGVGKQVDRNLEVAGIRERLIFAHSADDVEAGKTKPHPRPYLKALDELNNRIRALDADHVDITADECLVIEDTSSGAAAGLAAGMKVLHWTLNAGKYNQDAHYKLEPNGRLDVFLTEPAGVPRAGCFRPPRCCRCCCATLRWR